MPLRETGPARPAQPYQAFRKHLNAIGISTAELCRRSGIRYQLLINILNGYQRPSADVIRRTADVLGKPPAELWGEGSVRTEGERHAG